jgi:hypothetical protein
LPSAVLARLRRNLADNTIRMRAMMEETVSIHREFELEGISHALLKGFSLWPDSAPKPGLRSQLDLDFLVAEPHISAARTILERRSYRLCAVSGRTWEFKTDHVPRNSLDDLYKNRPSRSVELHVEAASSRTPSLLAAAETRTICGASLPVLSPANLFLGQAMHLFKNLTSDGYRAAHLLEFRRHVLARRNDSRFWNELRSKVRENPQICMALGVVLLFTARAMGEFAPQAFSAWTLARVPASARLWIEVYGLRHVLAGYPGSKLYLLLQQELATGGIPARRPLARALLPLRPPPAIAPAVAGESFSRRIRRYRLQTGFVLFRLRFHVVEGLRYAWERARWRRIRQEHGLRHAGDSGEKQSNDNSLTAA